MKMEGQKRKGGRMDRLSSMDGSTWTVVEVSSCFKASYGIPGEEDLLTFWKLIIQKLLTPLLINVGQNYLFKKEYMGHLILI